MIFVHHPGLHILIAVTEILYAYFNATDDGRRLYVGIKTL